MGFVLNAKMNFGNTFESADCKFIWYERSKFLLDFGRIILIIWGILY